MEPLVRFAGALGATALLATALWPRAPRLSVAAWLLGLAALFWAFWDHPGLIPVCVGMPVVFFVLCARAAQLEAPELSRLQYLRYVTDLTQPLPSQATPAPPRGFILRRLARGILLGALAAGLMVVGTQLEPWRVCPYLDDLLVLIEAPLIFTAFADLLTSSQWLIGRPLPDVHDGTFVKASSLRVFWRRWNGAVSTVLARSLFLPISRGRGRRAMFPAVLAAFGASGALHAIPLLLATPDRRLNALLFAACMGFFLIHGLGVLVEGKLPRHWRRGWQGRVWVWGVFAASIWLYPVTLGALISHHGRPVESLTFLVLLGF